MLFEVFEKLTSCVFFSNCTRNHVISYLLIIYTYELCRIESYACVTCKIMYSLLIVNIFTTEKTFVRTTEVKQCVLITEIVKISKIALYFLKTALLSANQKFYNSCKLYDMCNRIRI